MGFNFSSMRSAIAKNSITSNWAAWRNCVRSNPVATGALTGMALGAVGGFATNPGRRFRGMTAGAFQGAAVGAGVGLGARSFQNQGYFLGPRGMVRMSPNSIARSGRDPDVYSDLLSETRLYANRLRDMKFGSKTKAEGI